MSKISGTLAFGTKVTIEVPMSVDPANMGMMLKMAETMLNTKISKLIEETLSKIGGKVTIHEAKVVIQPERIEP